MCACVCVGLLRIVGIYSGSFLPLWDTGVFFAVLRTVYLSVQLYNNILCLFRNTVLVFIMCMLACYEGCCVPVSGSNYWPSTRQK